MTNETKGRYIMGEKEGKTARTANESEEFHHNIAKATTYMK